MTDFEKHYSELFDYVYRYVYVRLRDKEHTDDVVSTIFLSAFEKQSQFRQEKGTWRQWITGIARNTLYKYWQSTKEVLELDELNIAQESLQKFNEQHLKNHQELYFQSIMDRVSPLIRMLLALRYEEDLTYESIAEILGKKPAAIRKTFSRLHQQLSAQFKDFND